MRTWATAFLAGLLVFGIVVPASAGQQGDPFQEESDWIVTLNAGVPTQQAAAGLARGAGGDLGFVYDKVLGGFSFRGSPQAAAALRRNPLVNAVVADQLFTLQEVETGVSRIDGDELHALGGGAYRGAGIRVAVIDSGIDLDHPDLVANIDQAAGTNCVAPGASADDDNSHGTHVAGIIGAELNGSGVVGVAPEVSLVAVKAFDATGNATTAQVLCGINHVAGLAADGIPTVANMSFGEAGADSTCDDGDTSDAIHEAICDLTDTGVIAVAAAGNNAGSADDFIPARFDETISVSALTDLDGLPGGLGGCLLIFIFCDDEFASFSNYGPTVDVIAPGDPIRSTIPGGYGEKSGTSMAAPHVSGVVAAMMSADPALTTSTAKAVLQISGECPSGAVNTGGPTCEGEIWTGDQDGIGEPLINAMRAVELTIAIGGGGGNIPPIASFDTSCDDLTCQFTDTSWEPDGTVSSWSWDFGDGGTSTAANPTHVFAADGTYEVTLMVTDNDGDSGTTMQPITVPFPYNSEVQGDWAGVVGADGYWLGAWNGASDLADSALATFSADQGLRHTWAAPTADVRALEAPDESERRAAALYDSLQAQVTLTFNTAYTGNLHVYAVDWDSGGRRQTVTVSDGISPQVVEIDGDFSLGAWMHFTVDVGAGDQITVQATNNGPGNAVLSGVFLGDDVPTPPPPPGPPGLGDWVGVYGADGYFLGAWDGSTDLAVADGVTFSVSQASRHTWELATGENRALEAPDESFRRAAALYGSEVRVTMDFAEAYVGDLHLYSIDWDAGGRRQTITVDDGNGSQVATLDADFEAGMWSHFAVDVAAGGSVSVVVANTGPTNAVLSGVFLGNDTPTPPPPPPPPPPSGIGDWVGTYGADGYWLGAWNGGSDLAASDLGTFSVVQGLRHTWADPAIDGRALEAPDESVRKAAALYNSSQVQVRLDFAADYLGDLHVYAVDWDAGGRLQTVTVNDGNGPQQVVLDGDFSDGIWMHFTVDVVAGESVTITAINDGAGNSVLSGVFLGNDVPAPPPPPPPPPPPGLGDWVGDVGADGYFLGAWNGSADLVVSDWMSVVVERASRHTWESATSDGRALEAPDQSFRRMAALYDSSEVRLSLGFDAAYLGDLRLYAVDWDSTVRRQNVVVDDGNGPQLIALDGDFSQGAWIEFPVDVAPGGSVSVVVTNTGPTNAVLSGIFLGGDTATPPPPPPPPPPAGLGDWVGTYGADGYALAAWNKKQDLVSADFPSIDLQRGRRHRWSSDTSETRALESPDETVRRAAAYYQRNKVQVLLTFDQAYAGNLHLYALDWDSTSRRQVVTVDDGNGPQTVDLAESFADGAWMHFAIDVGAGGTVLITATKTGGSNAVISGMFLGE